MKYIKIENTGELDSRGISLLGASVKKADSIGMFGSGLTYSIAYLLRNNIAFHIFSGEREIEIKTEREIFRDKTFNVLIVDRNKTSITTESGPKWEITDVIREIYCNALDETKTSEVEVKENPRGTTGTTTFWIELTAEIDTMLLDWEEYFSDKLTILAETPNGNILLPNTNGRLYYKGIWCSGTNNNWRYSYDSQDFMLNESRKADSWYAENQIKRILCSCEERKVIKTILQAPCAEQNLIGQAGYPFSTAWKRELQLYDGKIVSTDATMFLSSMELRGALIVSSSFLAKVIADLGLTTLNKIIRGCSYKQCTLRSDQHARVLLVIQKLKKAGYEINFEICGGQFEQYNIIALADVPTKRIILAVQKIDEQTEVELASTLLEEYFHIQEGLHDETREFQTFLLDELAARCIATKVDQS